MQIQHERTRVRVDVGVNTPEMYAKTAVIKDEPILKKSYLKK